MKILDLEERSRSRRAAAAEEELSPLSPLISDPGIGTVTCFCPSQELAAQLLQHMRCTSVLLTCLI